jgi:hypothetical protein
MFFHPGLPDLSWYNKPKRGKIYQITLKYTKLPQKYTKLPQKYQIYVKTVMANNFLLQIPPKFTQIGIFGFKI